MEQHASLKKNGQNLYLTKKEVYFFYIYLLLMILFQVSLDYMTTEKTFLKIKSEFNNA